MLPRRVLKSLASLILLPQFNESLFSCPWTNWDVTYPSFISVVHLICVCWAYHKLDISYKVVDKTRKLVIFPKYIAPRERLKIINSINNNINQHLSLTRFVCTNHSEKNELLNACFKKIIWHCYVQVTVSPQNHHNLHLYAKVQVWTLCVSNDQRVPSPVGVVFFF